MKKTELEAQNLHEQYGPGFEEELIADQGEQDGLSRNLIDRPLMDTDWLFDGGLLSRSRKTDSPAFTWVPSLKDMGYSKDLKPTNIMFDGNLPGTEYRNLPAEEIAPVLKEMLRCHIEGEFQVDVLSDDVAWIKVVGPKAVTESDLVKGRYISYVLLLLLKELGLEVIDAFDFSKYDEVYNVIDCLAVSRQTALANKDLPVPGLVIS